VDTGINGGSLLRDLRRSFRSTREKKVMKLLYLFIISLCFVISKPAIASSVVPEVEWTPMTHLWTARVGVAEVGWVAGDHAWEKQLEQRAVWYVLRTRWTQMKRRWPDLRFIDVVKAYCTSGRFERTQRQKWLRGLTFSGEEPNGWPKKASWKKHSKYWMKTVDAADRWARRGAFRNPCPGASYFGGTRAGDVPKGKMVRHECSEIFERYGGSTFYYVSR